MHSFVQMVASSVDIVALGALFIFALFFILFTLRAFGGGRFPLRHIPLYERIRHLIAQAIETNRPLHIGLGSGGLGSVDMAESLMALTVFASCVRQTTVAEHALRGTTADGTVLAAALGILHRQAREAGHSRHSQSKEVLFYGPDPFAYAGGVRQTLATEPHLANILTGHFGGEGLWISEANVTRVYPQLGGTAPPTAAALFALSLDDYIIGEDLFAAGAYLGRTSHLGSLATQDLMRIVTILAVLVGVVLTSLGYWG